MWFKNAHGDLLAAKLLVSADEELFSGIVFHFQQCAEKAIKGFLTFHNVRVLKTHNIEKLLESVASIDQALAAAFDEVTILTKYAVEYRYPDVEFQLPPLNIEVVKSALSLAEKVYGGLVAKVRLPLPLS